MRTTYTLGESCELLGGIDRQTLRRWLRAAHLSPRRDQHDQRKWRLARWQVLRLAHRHDLVIEDVADQRVQQRRMTLGARLERLEAQVEHEHERLLANPRTIIVHPGLIGLN